MSDMLRNARIKENHVFIAPWRGGRVFSSPVVMMNTTSFPCHDNVLEYMLGIWPCFTKILGAV